MVGDIGVDSGDSGDSGDSSVSEDTGYDSTGADQSVDVSDGNAEAGDGADYSAPETAKRKDSGANGKDQEADYDFSEVPWDKLDKDRLMEFLGDRKLPMKINKEDREVSIKDIFDSYQPIAAAQENFKRASDMQKQNQNLLRHILSNPVDTMKRMGIDFDAIAYDRLSQIAEEHRLAEENPQALEAQKLKARYQQLEAENQRLRQEQEQRLFEAQTKQSQSNFENQFKQTLEGLGMPVTQYNMQLLAREALPFIKGGVEPPLSQLAQKVWATTQGHSQTLLNSLDGEKLLEYLGKDIMGKIRKADIATTKKAQAKAKPKAESRKLPREPRTSEELEKMIFGED